MAKTSHSTSSSIAYAALRRAGFLSGRHARIWVWVKRLPAMITQACSVQHHASGKIAQGAVDRSKTRTRLTGQKSSAVGVGTCLTEIQFDSEISITVLEYRAGLRAQQFTKFRFLAMLSRVKSQAIGLRFLIVCGQP
jgi:hypothetical protein